MSTGPARRPRAAGALVAAVVLGAGLLGAATPAAADPDLTHARAQAAALRVTVDRLRADAEAAAEDYGQADQDLNAVVSQLLLADENVDSASVAAAQAQDRASSAAAQMYMSGSVGAIYASVLDGQSISDVLDRIASVNSVMRGDVLTSRAAQAVVTAARLTHADLDRLTAQRHVLEARRSAAAARAATLLAQAQVQLDSATELVRSLVEQERAAAEAAAEAAARAAALVVDPGWTAEPVPADSLAAVDRAIAEAGANPATPYAVGALTDARRWLGTPYSAGGGGRSGPSTGWCSSSAPDDGRDSTGACRATATIGFDCSSLMVRIFSAGGLDLPRTSREQWKVGVHVTLDQLAPGDLLFWANDVSNPGSIHHVALYLGHGLMLHSPHTGDHVRVAQVYFHGLIGAVRP